MTLEKIKELWAEDGMYSLEDYVVEADEWTQDGKYQSQTTIIKFEDKFYQINRSRSGSYHTDWYYNNADIFEVERKEETVTIVKVSWVYAGKPSIELPED